MGKYPQADYINKIVWRTYNLVDTEIEALRTAQNIVWSEISPWEASHAGFERAIVAGRSLAWRKAEAAVSHVPPSVASVACALTIRDLIDKNTPWNRKTYDLLTVPWSIVFGPAHPDD